MSIGEGRDKGEGEEGEGAGWIGAELETGIEAATGVVPIDSAATFNGSARE